MKEILSLDALPASAGLSQPLSPIYDLVEAPSSLKKALPRWAGASGLVVPLPYVYNPTAGTPESFYNEERFGNSW